jgi:UDP-N-acetylglucosamine--N-acetylmuramyl-(pentapeptide) pyrophosphoryl-undecaprenol N-acetylglucosamine transferase
VSVLEEMAENRKKRQELEQAGRSDGATSVHRDRFTVLVMGGSQGARAINELVLQSLARLAGRLPEAQFFHLSGSGPLTEKLIQAYATLKLKAVVHPFFADMQLALGAATAAVCRSGASSLAELAAMRVPAVLIPYPTASDNHQFHNARAFEATGAARLLEQKNATPELLVQMLSDLIEKPVVHEQIQSALVQWHSPHAAEQIAEAMLAALGAGVGQGFHADRRGVAAPGSLAVEPGDKTKPPASPRAGRLRTGRSTATRTPLLAGRGV